MAKFRVWYDIGGGRQEWEIEAENEDEALEEAYETFSEDCEERFSWGVEELEEEEEEEAEHDDPKESLA